MDLKLNEDQVLAILHYDGDLVDEVPTFREALERFIAALGGLELRWNEQVLEQVAYYFDDEQRGWLKRLAEAGTRLDEAAMVAEVGEEQYNEQKNRRFGESNPERMNLAFWELMVRRRWIAWRARTDFEPACREYMAKLHALPHLSPKELEALSDEERAAFNVQWDAVKYKHGDAVWCFYRFGQTHTRLPDGREIWIGGEHEDWYDSDFCIYNDVVVIDEDLKVEIYGYPRQLFRPTDFHTATLVDDSIYIIGCLGYYGTQPIGETPVLRLNTKTFAMEKVETTGDNPGWIWDHTALYVPERNAIRISGGKVLVSHTRKRGTRKNRRVYWLDLATGNWTTGTG